MELLEENQELKDELDELKELYEKQMRVIKWQTDCARCQLDMTWDKCDECDVFTPGLEEGDSDTFLCEFCHCDWLERQTQ